MLNGNCFEHPFSGCCKANVIAFIFIAVTLSININHFKIKKIMKASDLRIGNLVEISDDHKNEIYSYQEIEVDYPENNHFEIASISKNEANIYIFKEEFDFDLSDLKPIQLSKVWFEKLGWKEIEKNLFDNTSYNVAFEKIGNEYKRWKNFKKIKYVHELQNYMLFAHDVELTL